MKYSIPIAAAAATVTLAVAIPVVYGGSGQSGGGGYSANHPGVGNPGGSFGWLSGGGNSRGVPLPDVGTGIPALLTAAGFLWLTRRPRRGS